MAVYYFRNVNGNWGTAANWSLSDNGPSDGAVPTSADDAYFTSNSGNCTVAATSACKTLICAGVGAGNYTGTFTLNALLDVFGTITLSSGMTLAGTNQLRLNTTATLTSAGKTVPWAILWGGTAQTYTLADNWNFSGNISFTATTSLTINSNQIISTSTVNIGAAGVSGNTTIVMAGTGAIQGSGTVACNLNINSPSGTITIGSAGSPNLRFNTNTLTYTAGTIAYGSVTGGLSIQGNCTLNTSGMTWQNVVFNAANTTTLTSDLNISGAITVSFATVINGASRTVNVGGNLTINQATSGTATIQLTGTGTWSTTGFGIQNNLIFNNGVNSFTISGTVYYGAGTMTYTSGTIVTTGSTLAIFSSCTLNTNGITWEGFLPYNVITITLSSTFNSTGALTLGNVIASTISFSLGVGATFNHTGSINYLNTFAITFNLPNSITVTNFTCGNGGSAGMIINGVGFNLNVTGNLSVNNNNFPVNQLSGTATIVMTGTGTLGSTASNRYGIINNSIIINTTGTITLVNRVELGGSLTYTAGTFNANDAVVIFLGGFSLTGFDNIFWDCTAYIGWASGAITINSNLNAKTFVVGGFGTISGTGVINCGNFLINNSISGTVNVTATLNVDVYASGNVTFGPGPPGDFQINGGKTIFVGGDLSMSAPTNIYGSGIVRMVGTGTISSAANYRQFDLIIDTPGKITITGILYWNLAATAIAAKTITYLRGNVVAKGATLFIGNMNATFTNMHKIPWSTVTITSGQTITLNEFFSGNSSYKTIVQPSSTTNYTITFTDNLERFARNVKISRTTLTRPDQLTVITDKGNNGNNIGIKFYSNQMPNGIAKNTPSVPTQTTFSPGGLVSDPAFI